MCSDIPGDRHVSMQDRHFASQQPSFAPNEFVYRWLSRTNSSPPEDEREQPHHDLDAISPAHYEHVERYLLLLGSQLEAVLTHVQVQE
jgi:hypothetical protein